MNIIQPPPPTLTNTASDGVEVRGRTNRDRGQKEECERKCQWLSCEKCEEEKKKGGGGVEIAVEITKMFHRVLQSRAINSFQNEKRMYL